MKDHIEQLFEQARETELVLPENQFMAALGHRLDGDTQSLPASYDWMLCVAVVLAVCVVFLFTPVSFWVSAIAYVNLGFQSLMFLSFSMLALFLSSFWLFDWDRI